MVRDIGLWVWVAIIVVAIGLIVWLVLSRARRRPIPSEAITHARPGSVQPQEPVRMATPLSPVAAGAAGGEAILAASGQTATVTAAPTVSDDLEVIEGIGPKIASILQTAGIGTFADLAAADTDCLSTILREGGLRAPADPATWPEQAGMAREGRWDELTALQDRLKGGRQV